MKKEERSRQKRAFYTPSDSAAGTIRSHELSVRVIGGREEATSHNPVMCIVDKLRANVEEERRSKPAHEELV